MPDLSTHVMSECANKCENDSKSKSKQASARDFNALTKVITSSLVECMAKNPTKKMYMAKKQNTRKNQTCNKRTRTYVNCRWKEATQHTDIIAKN